MLVKIQRSNSFQLWENIKFFKVHDVLVDLDEGCCFIDEGNEIQETIMDDDED